MAKRTVGVKLEPEILARIDALTLRLSTRWRLATRSDALRAVIVLGVERLEADAAPDGAVPPPVQPVPP